MLPIAKRQPADEPDVQARFLEMLPRIAQQARVASRNLRGAEREERIAEVIALAFCMFHRLAERGMLDSAYPTPIARYAIRQALAGRGAGVKLNVHDVTSAHCQRTTGIRVQSLELVHVMEDDWQEMLSDKRATPAEIASCRIDVGDWFRLLSTPLRRVAKTLASGERTRDAARQYGVSPGRISQIRRELKLSWDRFQGEAAEPAGQLAGAVC